MLAFDSVMSNTLSSEEKSDVNHRAHIVEHAVRQKTPNFLIHSQNHVCSGACRSCSGSEKGLVGEKLPAVFRHLPFT